MGVTLIRGIDDTKENAVKRADECLYQAKESGRNVVIVDFGQGRIPAQTFLGTNPEV